MVLRGPQFDKLVLPARYEILEERAKAAEVPLTKIVRQVESATRRVDGLLRQVRDQGLGRFEFVFGLSGSGKTTFLKTLPEFFAGAPVNEVPKEISLEGLVDFLRERRRDARDHAVYVLLERDNPQASDDVLRRLFDALRVFFREDEGGIVLLWPITDLPFAQRAAAIAWEVGRDSLLDVTTKGIFTFTGLDKATFYDVADITTVSLNGGRPLEAFGITPSEAEPLLDPSGTISEFYNRLQRRAAEIAGQYGEVLKARVVPRVWILLAGDEAKDAFATVSQLTYGVRGEIDVRRLLAYLNEPGLDAAYLREWKKRRTQMVLLMNMLDVRLFILTPNVSLGAARLHGTDKVKEVITTKAANADQVIAAVGAASFYKAVLSPEKPVVSAPTDTVESTAAEYNRLQSLAARADKLLNKALGLLLSASLTRDGVECEVIAEKQSLPDSNLKPDIQMRVAGGRIICLEPTWRTTGKPVPGGRGAAQNTLTAGHIQQYVLEKVLSYVEDLGL